MDSASKTDTVSGPPPGDRAGSRVGQDAGGCAFRGSRRENRETTASTKEAFEKGGIENPSLQGEKRTAFDDLGTKASKRGKKSSLEDPAPGDAPAALFPQRDQPSSEP